MNHPTLTLKNPHSVLAALLKRPKEVQSIEVSPQLMRQNEKGSEAMQGRDAWLKVIREAEKNRIPIRSASTNRTESRDREALAQATVIAPRSTPLNELFTDIDPNDRRLWIAIDQVQDPHNLGSIFRSAAFFGVAGIISTSERAASLTATVLDVACGGVEAVPFAVETNLVRALEKAKEAGVWVLGTSEHAEQSLKQVQKDRPWLLVLGNEEKGLRRLTLENCDMVCTIPGSGEVTSLNVSVAAGILISALS